MNKTELNKILKWIDRIYSKLNLTKGHDTCACLIEVIVKGVLDIAPNTVHKVDYEIEGSELRGIELSFLIDNMYTGRGLSKDIISKRPKFAKLDTLHKGVSIDVIIDRFSCNIVVSICADYTIIEGYKEKSDIIPIIEKDILSNK